MQWSGRSQLDGSQILLQRIDWRSWKASRDSRVASQCRPSLDRTRSYYWSNPVQHGETVHARIRFEQFRICSQPESFLWTRRPMSLYMPNKQGIIILRQQMQHMSWLTLQLCASQWLLQTIANHWTIWLNPMVQRWSKFCWTKSSRIFYPTKHSSVSSDTWDVKRESP